VPLGNYFAGNLDGGGYTIDGIELTILAANVNAAGYGLFGRIDGGTVQNLTIDGSIHTDYNNNVVGGLVGYTNGNITNVINKASVTALGAGVSETAGIAAVAENTNTETVLTISGCVNFGAIRGRSRLAGIVGAAYCAAQDGTVIENSYNAGNITAGNGSGTAYVGGVVGYCVGKIANVYNTGDVSAILSGTRFFVGGIVGLLNGGGVFGSLSDSYNVGNITSVSTLGDTQPLYAYADNSPNVIIRNSVYNADGGMTQDQLGATWPDGTVKGVPTSVLQSQTILDVSTYLDPTYFDQYSADYPVLDIQVATLSSSAQADFVNALNAMTGLKNVLLISDFAVGISSSTVTIDIGDINGVIYRAPGYISNLFNVTGTGLMNFQSGTIDGNAAGAGTTSVAGSLIDIGGAGAQLTIGPGATLKNNTTTSNGAAVLVNSGTLVMNGGTITGNTTTGNGGGVYVAAAGTFNLNGGTISGNTATLGEGIYATGTNAVNYRIVINPGSSNIISVSDVIYLNGPNTRIDLNATLTQTNINGNLLIRVSNPGTARVVVRTGSITMASDSLPYIKRWTGDSMSIDSTDQTLIDYNGTTFTDALYESEN
jgi:hypothetical protein